ncbi:protein MCM10 homolog [Haliotis rubra]|uniref:protein MCM10 homolog n=1 Tax=Haliotis rubra TaxID=36100 RepID=UPI001EE5C93D|nr:protein MCM10 homolog [Haliotis rubra]XP_046562192.1 protein MCM10 homolog [Haliotis rubra]XP_046562193.1 protein MCM10 homolog [Haliotis rubra]XP_046562194.1 protein MCM10 homolog [Haliotis rubra]
MADDCDLDELVAFLDEDSNEAFGSGEEPGEGMTKGSSKTVVTEEMDADAEIPTLEKDLCEAVVPSAAPATDSNQTEKDDCDPESIAAFLGESDDSDEEFTLDSKDIAKPVKQPDVIAPTDPNTAALQAELAAMQKRDDGTQQQLLSQSSAQTPSTTKTSSTTHKPPTPQTRLTDESEDANPFFPTSTSQKEKKSSKTPGRSPGQRQVGSNRLTPKQSAAKPSCIEQADRQAMKKDLFGESDSEGEDMDGEKTGLSAQGREIKTLLNAGPKHREAHNPSFTIQAQNEPALNWKTKNVVTKDSLNRISPPASKPSSKPEEKFIVDPFTGIRIVRPLVSSGEMELKMKNRKVIKLSRLHLKVNTADLQGDWVTIGVVVQKTEPKTSSSGKTYCIWKLSDMDNCEQMVSFFLFGQTYKEHWKSDVGSVIGILNPSIMDNADKGNKDVAFTINNPKQLLHMGRSKDLGWCSGRTKKGNQCNHFINKKYGDFCNYHVQSAYRKTSATRSELQGSVTGLTPKSFKDKLLPKKGSHFFYGGQTFTSLPNVKTSAPKKDRVTLGKLQVEQKLTKSKVTTMSLHELKTCDPATMKKAATSEKEQAFIDMISTPTVGSMNLVKHLVKQEKSEKVIKEKSVVISVTPKEMIQQHKKDMMEKRRAREAATAASSPRPTVNPLKATPSIGKGLLNGQDVFLDFSANRKPFAASPANKQVELAKRKAIQKIHSKGGLAKEDPNSVMKKSPNAEKVKKRVLENSLTEDQPDNDNECKEPPRKRSRLLGNVDINSEEFKKLLKTKSAHKGALAEAEAEREEKYFTELEKKEMMEEKMLAVTKLEVTVVTCRQCKYTAFSATDACKNARHDLHRHKGIKSFFKCKHCKHRTVSLDKYPKDACKNCGSSTFERTSMAREKTGPKLESETLCLRGDEVKFLSSLGGQVFMNS